MTQKEYVVIIRGSDFSYQEVINTKERLESLKKIIDINLTFNESDNQDDTKR